MPSSSGQGSTSSQFVSTRLLRKPLPFSGYGVIIFCSEVCISPGWSALWWGVGESGHSSQGLPDCTQDSVTECMGTYEPINKERLEFQRAVQISIPCCCPCWMSSRLRRVFLVDFASACAEATIVPAGTLPCADTLLQRSLQLKYPRQQGLAKYPLKMLARQESIEALARVKQIQPMPHFAINGVAPQMLIRHCHEHAKHIDHMGLVAERQWVFLALTWVEHVIVTLARTRHLPAKRCRR